MERARACERRRRSARGGASSRTQSELGELSSNYGGYHDGRREGGHEGSDLSLAPYANTHRRVGGYDQRESRSYSSNVTRDFSLSVPRPAGGGSGGSAAVDGAAPAFGVCEDLEELSRKLLLKTFLWGYEKTTRGFQWGNPADAGAWDITNLWDNFHKYNIIEYLKDLDLHTKPFFKTRFLLEIVVALRNKLRHTNGGCKKSFCPTDSQWGLLLNGVKELVKCRWIDDSSRQTFLEELGRIEKNMEEAMSVLSSPAQDPDLTHRMSVVGLDEYPAEIKFLAESGIKNRMDLDLTRDDFKKLVDKWVEQLTEEDRRYGGVKAQLFSKRLQRLIAMGPWERKYSSSDPSKHYYLHISGERTDTCTCDKREYECWQNKTGFLTSETESFDPKATMVFLCPHAPVVCVCAYACVCAQTQTHCVCV